MSQIYKVSLFLFLLLIVILSCSTRPNSLIKEGKMVEVMIDLYKAEAIFKNDKKYYMTDEDKEVLINSILKKHKITEEQFSKSLEWYADNIDSFGAIQDTVKSLLQKEYDVFSEEYKNLYSFKLAGFRTELPEHYILDFENPTFSFCIDSSDIKKIDIADFRFRFTPQGIDTTIHNLEATLYYVYKDTTTLEKRRITTDIEYDFSKPASDSLLKGIAAYIHLNDAKINSSKILLSCIGNFDVKPEVLADSLQTENLALEQNIIE